MFRTHFDLHVSYDKGSTLYMREEQLPFAPFIGLDLLDDAIGEFKVEHIAWASDLQAFFCQASVNLTYLSLRKATARLKKGGWVEEPQARESQAETAVAETTSRSPKRRAA